MKNWPILALGAGAAVIAVLRARHQHRDRRTARAEIRNWEAEGGNIPQVPTVQPVVRPAKSVPDVR